MENIERQVNGFGERLNRGETEIARHDERLKHVENWIPDLQKSIDSLKELIHKVQLKQVAIYTGIVVVVQIVFHFFPQAGLK